MIQRHDAAADQPLLKVRDLAVTFGSGERTVHAVNGISYDLARGETLGVVGESGCGKSVSSLALMRLLPKPAARITSGEIIFDGEEILSLSEDDVRAIRGNRIAMIFQDPMTSLNPVLSVERQLTEVLETHKKLKRRGAINRAVELLELVGIPAARRRLNDYPHQFSGGMRQRVMIAMALACDPQLLIADEPTTALDVTIQAQILDLMRSAVSEFDTALILITHDLGVVAGMARKINVMYAGHIVERAGTDELYGRPRHPYTIGLLQSIPRLDAQGRGELVPIQGQPPDLSRTIAGCPFAARCFNVQERCRVEMPPLEQASNAVDGHEVACWYPAEGERLVPSGFEAEKAS
ncbi:MAG: ABC transporter ATP-binding protein [Chloroflexi bacterium]|nr:ABC transporter ATP-binding protein [Chloroflexota bacterium]MBA3740531.1 ABC transporter ATP-binding protein [Chloroflexota bacterium]